VGENNPNIHRFEDIIELDLSIDTELAINELKQVPASNWRPEKGRLYLDFIGDQNLENNVRPNDSLEHSPTIKDFLQKIPDVRKMTCQRMDSGVFFAPHRDFFKGGERFRILVALNNTEMEEYIFFYDGKIFEFKPGKAYVINTARIHGSMSFIDETYHLRLSVNLTDESIKFLNKTMRFGKPGDVAPVYFPDEGIWKSR
jgi:hypothetical protein